ncbi:MAG: hypothetical protein M9930_14235 [Anaerolineae bacterium]|nr:hypothetical protein [Anaerolineae bacterium]
MESFGSSVFGEDRCQFGVKQYQQYLDVIRPMAAELGWQVQEVDLAIWQLDRDR